MSLWNPTRKPGLSARNSFIPAEKFKKPVESSGTMLPRSTMGTAIRIITAGIAASFAKPTTSAVHPFLSVVACGARWVDSTNVTKQPIARTAIWRWKFVRMGCVFCISPRRQSFILSTRVTRMRILPAKTNCKSSIPTFSMKSGRMCSPGITCLRILFRTSISAMHAALYCRPCSNGVVMGACGYCLPA